MSLPRILAQTKHTLNSFLSNSSLGVDFTFAGDNHKNDHDNDNDNDKNDNHPHLCFVKGTVLGDKEQGLGIRDKGYGIRDKG